MRQIFMAALTVLTLFSTPAASGTVDEDLANAVALMGELQACLAGGLSTGGITPSPEDMAAVRAILTAADPLLRQASTLSRKAGRSPQEQLLLTAWARGGLAMLTTAQDYRLEHGY